MKKTGYSFLLMIWILLCVSLEPGHARASDPDAEGSGTDPVRIICFLPYQSGMVPIVSEITAGLSEGMQSADHALLSVYSFDDFGNGAFSDAVETFIAMQGDIMIAFGPNHDEESGKLIAENHVKLILLDTDNANGRIAFIGTDNRGAVREILAKIREELKQANIAVFITHRHSTTLSRLDEVLLTDIEDPEIEVLSMNYLSSNSIEAYRQMKEILEEDEEINTILCLDGFSSQTAASVIPSVDRKYYTAAFDASEETVDALVKGNFDLLVVQNYRAMGRLAVETALSVEEKDEPIEVYEPAVLYTSRNAGALAEDYLNE